MVEDLIGDYLKSNRCIYSLDFDNICGKKASIYLLHIMNSYGKNPKKIYLCSCSNHFKSFPKDLYKEIPKEDYFEQFKEPDSDSDSEFKKLCGACSKDRHMDCSGWCFCSCEYNQPIMVTPKVITETQSKIEPENEWEKFIWSKPMNLLAKDLNVSIPTLRKRCFQVGVKTPPVGFWSKK